MPLSTDPEKRARQLANLQSGKRTANLVPGAGQEEAARAAVAVNLRTGARTEQPQRSPLWSPAVELAIVDLAGRVGDELRDQVTGELHAWAVPSVEAVAIQRVACMRMERHVGELEDRGKLTPDVLDQQSKVGARYHRALEREALTLRSRLEARVAVVSLAEQMSGTGGGADA